MNGTPLRIGVIGAGPMGRLHARAIARRRDLHGDCELSCVVDRHAQRSEAVGREFGAPTATDWRTASEKLDAAIVAVPTRAHAALVLALLDDGLDVLVEKPFTLAASEARGLVERAAEAERILQVGLSEWYNPAWRVAVRSAGAIRSIEVERLHPRTGRGLDLDVVQDFMIHDLDWISRWLGEPVEGLIARGRKCLNARWDEAEAELRFGSGVRARLRASRVADRRVRKLRVEGASAVIEADLISGVVEVAHRSTPTPAPRESGIREPARAPTDGRVVETSESSEPLDRQLAEFLRACRTRTAPESDGAVGVAALELVERVQRAIEVAATTRVAGDGEGA